MEEALRDSEAIIPSETGNHNQLVTLKREPAFVDVFSDMDLITYRVDAAGKQPSLRRLMALARALTQDMIAPQSRQSTLKKVFDEFDKEVSALRDSGQFDSIAKAVKALALRTLTIEYGTDTASTADAETVELSEYDLNNLFERAGKILGGDLHKDYLVRHAKRDYDVVKTEIIVMASDNASMERLESFSDKLFNELYDYHKTALRKLKEERRDVYKRMAQSSASPILLSWDLPQAIDFSVGEDGKVYESHLFVPEDGTAFKASLNDWESGVVKEEMKNGAVAWLRTLTAKSSRWRFRMK
ncbi:MAG: hypothetical protein LBN40_05745 [Oscillospiraceae bacterium]|nr:hypothetical protein [Oscillospiraceae bacterium]